MSNRNFQGYVNVDQVMDQSMFTLRANLASTKLKAAVKSATGMVLPKLGRCVVVGGCSLAWMSPDELLISTSSEESKKLYANLEASLSGQHVLLEDVSDARAKFNLTGAHVREVLAKLVPMDTHPDQFSVGSFNRTRFAQVAGAVLMEKENVISLICFRSVQDYVFALFSKAAAPKSEVF